MSGMVGLALMFAAKFWSNDTVPNLWLWTACAACFFVAMYRAWAKEFDRAEAANSTDIGSIHEANTRLSNRIAEFEDQQRSRRLSDHQKRSIAQTISASLAAMAREKDWPPKTGFTITVVAIGGEVETLDYRSDFIGAFESGGLVVKPEERPAGPPEFDRFRGSGVTVLRRDDFDDRNVVRKVVLEALSAAAIMVRESAVPELARNYQPHSTPLLDIYINPVVAELIVGQR